MEFFKKLKQILKKPFPRDENNLGILKTIVAVSIFITVFLYVFQPNDISSLESNRFLICVGFGLMTFIASIIYEYIISRYIIKRGEGAQFTFGRWIIYMTGTILLISLANFLFARIVIFGYIKWEVFPHMLYGTFIVGLFPFIALGAIALLRFEKKYQNIAEEINQKENHVSSLNLTKDLSVFEIPTNKIRYVEALQNYVKIGHINTHGQLVEKTERSTLKRVSEEVKGSSIVKCHRSYLVNQEAIISISGNAQGLILTLSDCDKNIPVSRSFIAQFRDK